MKRKCPICQTEYKTVKIMDEIIKDFPDRKDKLIEMECPNNDNHFKILRDREMAKISKDTKQKVLDLMHKGETIGEVGKILSLDTQLVVEIISQNLGTISYLRTKVE